MAKEKEVETYTARFNGKEIEVKSALIKDVYTYAETGKEYIVSNMGKYFMSTCFKRKGFMDEFAECLYTVREGLKQSYPERLVVLHTQFAHWLDSDYQDPAKVVSKHTIRKHLFLDQLSAYWEWSTEAMQVFADVAAYSPPEMYHCMYVLCLSVPRVSLLMDTVSDAFVSFLCLIRPPNARKAGVAWNCLCDHDNMVKPFLPLGSVYFDRLDKPFTDEEQAHVRLKFGMMGINKDPSPDTYDGPGNAWKQVATSIRTYAQKYVMSLETLTEKANTIALKAALKSVEECTALVKNAMNEQARQRNTAALESALREYEALEKSAGDVVKAWTELLSDEKREDADNFKEDTLIRTVITSRMKMFKAAAKELEKDWGSWVARDLARRKTLDKSAFYQDHIRFYSNERVMHRENKPWCVMRLMRLFLLERANEYRYSIAEYNSIAAYDGLAADSLEAKGARTDMIYLAKLITDQCYDDAIAFIVTRWVEVSYPAKRDE